MFSSGTWGFVGPLTSGKNDLLKLYAKVGAAGDNKNSEI